jgi:penicillin-binding protein 2
MNREWHRQFPSRRGIFLAGGAIVWGGLTLRLAELQLFRAQEFETKATENRIRLDPAPPHRGTIFDRHGRQVATNKRNFYVTLRPEMAGSAQDVEAIVNQLATLLPISDARKRSILQEARSQARFVDILIADDLTWEDFARINVMAPELAGVTAEVGELRSYPYYAAFYHTVGYVQKANEKDVLRMIEADLKQVGESPESPAGQTRIRTIRRLYKHPQMRVGKQGVEAFAETALKGEAGKTRVLVNAAGRVIDRLPSEDIAGAPGTDLVLSIDAELQNYAIQRFGTEAGSAVVMDVETGHILAMMSTPAPDPNAFVSGISQSLYDSYRNDERQPLYHKAYDGVYPPGSTFKTIVAAAALETGAMKPEDTVRCGGRVWYYNRFYHCWKPEGHGTVNMHTAMQKSCDCYFYECARRTGIEAIAEMAKRMGLGHRYELGLTGGKIGSVPNDAWKRENFKEKWYDGDTISAGIGQGYVTTTPLQLAVMCARIAGGPGVPHPTLLVHGAETPDQTIVDIGELKPETLAIVRAGMYAVTSEPGGTAYNYVQQGRLDPEGVLPAPYTNAMMAGKSGSAQVRVIRKEERNAKGAAVKDSTLPWRMRDHAWFVAFAPYDKPRYACSILIEHGSSGSQLSAPIAHDILAFCLQHDPGAKPAYSPQKEVATLNETAEPS